jgi:hypothetical protein
MANALKAGGELFAYVPNGVVNLNPREEHALVTGKSI